MKTKLCLLLLLVVLAAGCATTVEPTAIPVNPTAVPVVNPTAVPVVNPTTAPVQATNTPGLPPPSKCQSKLLGRVLDANATPAKGAVIEIKGGTFSGKTLSDDNGLYGFAGLCAGTYSFSVTLTGQQPKPVAATATVDGTNTVRADLNVK